ncbi:M28 family peptidase [Varunaivibrio sulfuroxidans]|uniref:Peptidase M28-like protein n=1 Tax=Varunaivibrio sulfuroxidans TaxID=1773489 RepID=A0A4R3J5K1_9PROT|nr:M28 family peptidase [Varunaivibrio sulfuroxidans]TCS60562.1 peptidase M28-like protein [Varunaivibrio sulfuroxidans]WES30052.1 M28 family peptidase [Varunaivibrio sulfuroxidans]
MSVNDIERILRYQVESVGCREAGSCGARRLFAFLREEVRACGYVTDEAAFPLRAMHIDALEHRIGSEVFCALPYFGCPPFYPYRQKIKLEAPLAAGSTGGEPPHGRVLLADIEGGALVEQILAHKTAGYRGVIFISDRDTDAELLGLFSPITSADLEEIAALDDFPVTCVSRRTGEMLRARARRGLCVRQDIDVSVRPTTARNLFVRHAHGVGSAEAGKRPRVRVICHYDSAFEAPDLPGASDNASGVAVLTAVLKDLHRQGACLPDVEFVYYDAEEYLLFGALSLLVDLNGECARRSWNGLSKVFAARDGAQLTVTEQPDHMIEIDTVGCGRTLRYGTDKPHEVADFLRTHDLGGMFDKIQLSREKGNVEHAAAQAGIVGGATYHFLTLGAGRRAHTRRDDLVHINRDDMDAFASFLKALIISI